MTRKATAQALVHYRGNRYSLPPELAGTTVTVTHRAGSTTLAIATGNGVTVAVHPRRADGTGATERTDTHVTALNTAALAGVHQRGAAPVEAADPTRPRRQGRSGSVARQQQPDADGPPATPVIDLAVYARAARVPPHPALTADHPQP